MENKKLDGTAKKISADQQQALFDFMQSKWVPYYDVQVELVDHFACAIENHWETNPDLDFDSAIQKVYRTFPITGFHQLIQAKTEAMQKEALRWIFHTWMSYFRWPRILMALSIILGIRLLFFAPINTAWMIWSFVAMIILGTLWTVYQVSFKIKKRKIRFLRVETTYHTTGGVFSFFFAFINLGYQPIWASINDLPSWACWLIAIGFTYTAFLIYILTVRLPNRAMQDLQQHFPKYAQKT